MLLLLQTQQNGNMCILLIIEGYRDYTIINDNYTIFGELLLVEKTGVFGENNQPATRNVQILSQTFS
jgi:hypothetical protein